MDIGVFIVLLLLFLATVVVIYALFNALASGQKMVKRQEEEQRKEQKYFSADSMNQYADSTRNSAKSKYGIICVKIIDDITLSIKERAKAGEKSELFSIRRMAEKYLHESCRLSLSQEKELSRDFRDKYFCVIRKHFENRGFVVSEIKELYWSDTEISWK